MALEKISDQELAPRNLSGFRSLLKKLAAMYNAQLNTQIKTDSGRNLRTISDSNDTWELDIKAAVAAVAAVSDFSLFDATKGTDLAVGVRFGNVTPDGVTCQLNPGLSAFPDDFSGSNKTTSLGVAQGVGYVWCEVTIQDGQDTFITSISLNNGVTYPKASSPKDGGDGTYTNYVTLGTYYCDGTKVTIFNSDGVGSQTVGFCGGIYFDRI